MEANWSSTWVMQPRMWQMPKSVWKKLEKNRADGCGWRGDAWSIAHMLQWMMTFLKMKL